MLVITKRDQERNMWTRLKHKLWMLFTKLFPNWQRAGHLPKRTENRWPTQKNTVVVARC